MSSQEVGANMTAEAQVVAAVSRAFRNEPSLRTVVLFGSVARGTARPDSDIDLAVAPIPSRAVAERVSARIDAATSRKVDFVDWDGARQSVELAARLLRDGIPLRDGAGEWSSLCADRRNVLRRGRRREAAWAPLERRVLG